MHWENTAFPAQFLHVYYVSSCHKNFKAARSKMSSISMLLKMLSISNAPQHCKKKLIWIALSLQRYILRWCNSDSLGLTFVIFSRGGFSLQFFSVVLRMFSGIPYYLPLLWMQSAISPTGKSGIPSMNSFNVPPLPIPMCQVWASQFF